MDLKAYTSFREYMDRCGPKHNALKPYFMIFTRDEQDAPTQLDFTRYFEFLKTHMEHSTSADPSVSLYHTPAPSQPQCLIYFDKNDYNELLYYFNNLPPFSTLVLELETKINEVDENFRDVAFWPDGAKPRTVFCDYSNVTLNQEFFQNLDFPHTKYNFFQLETPCFVQQNNLLNNER